jgi:maleylacetate reductase
VTTRRGAASVGDLPVVGVYDGVRPHVPVETVREAAALARELDADGLVGLGGGSAIDTCKAVVVEGAKEAQATVCCKVIAVPTTYAGAEWTPFYGMIHAPGRKGGGGDERARPVGAVYDPELTLGLPLPETVGTAMNALAHCAEAFYALDRGPRAERHAYAGARAISYALPLVVERPHDLYARSRLLEGAFRAAQALAEGGLALAHAMAQAIGGRYGAAHGAANAIVLAPALRFNAESVPKAVAAFGEAIRADDPVVGVTELARLGGPQRLRDLGVVEADLGELAAEAAARPGSRANPRAATPDDVEELYRAVW